MKKTHLSLIIILLLLTSSAADWPQYLGPERNGISPETDLAQSWPESGPKILWEVPLGEGFAAPAIADGKAYLLDRVDDEQDVFRCYDLQTGRELWNYAYEAPGKFSFNGSRAVPTIEARFAYTVGPMGHMYCFDLEKEEPVWNVQLLEAFDAKLPNWVVAQLPTIYGDTVVVAPQGAEGGVVALDKKTGETVWASRPLEGAQGYVSPNLITLDGVDQFVMLSAGKGDNRGEVVSFDAETGETLWSYDGYQNKIPITPVIQLPENRVLVSGGYDAGAVMLRVTPAEGAWEVEELFATDKWNCQIHPPIFYQGHLYMNSNSNSDRDGLMCATLDGQILWETGSRPNFERGGLILADGRIFNLEGDRGILHLIEPSPEEFKDLASVDLDLTNKAWGPLALSEGKLLVRDQEKMLCLEVSE